VVGKSLLALIGQRAPRALVHGILALAALDIATAVPARFLGSRGPACPPVRASSATTACKPRARPADRGDECSPAARWDERLSDRRTTAPEKIRQPQPMPEPNASSFSDLSVIIVTYNSSAVLPDCLRSLIRHVPNAEVIVVDNGSEDDTVQLAGSNPNVLVVAGHGNVGFGAGVNRGAQVATGRLLLILNPDAALLAVDPSELERLRRDDRDAVTGVIGCRVRDQKREHHLNFVAWRWRAELYWALSQYFLVPREVDLQRPRIFASSHRQWISGAAFMVCRREFLEVGGFDDEFFLYFEDFDLSRRYSTRGWPIRTTDAFTVSHVGKRSSPRDERTMEAYSLLSLIQYVHKWEGPRSARRAASQCLRLLRAIEVAGKACARVPFLGPRATKKQRSAAAVRLAIAAATAQPPAPGTYAAASAAVRYVLGNRPA
jgi:N-acetylglucosaminyl-diphospho-decaprenol L-rhamnosyltransferase